MKKFLKNAAVLTLFFATTSAIATEPKINLKTGNDAKSLVFEMDHAFGTSEIRLTDSNDKIFHFENISESSHTKKFNLKNLENGTYYFNVDNPLKKVVYTLTLKNREIIITNINESPQIPVLRISGDRVYFNLLNKDLNTVRVKVLNGNNEQLESQVFMGDFTIGKVFNFENALEDNYMVVVQDGKNIYHQTIAIK